MQRASATREGKGERWGGGVDGDGVAEVAECMGVDGMMLAAYGRLLGGHESAVC